MRFEISRSAPYRCCDLMFFYIFIFVLDDDESGDWNYVGVSFSLY